MGGEIRKIGNDFYLFFERGSNLVDYNNVSVTYGVDTETDYFNSITKDITDFKNLEFRDITSKEPDYLPSDLTSKTKNLATQYRESVRLKSLLFSILNQFQDVFLELHKIKNVLDLATATGANLNLIGKIVGVGRSYCGNFADVNHMFYKENRATKTVREITLSDACMKKLIIVKIIKNTKKIVNNKELREILAVFFEDENFSFMIDDFEIVVDAKSYNVSDECLILLRAFLPVQSNIKIYFLKNFMKIPDTTSVSVAYSQQSGLFLAAPKQVATYHMVGMDGMGYTAINIEHCKLGIPPYQFNGTLIGGDEISTKFAMISRYGLEPAPSLPEVRISPSGVVLWVSSVALMSDSEMVRKNESYLSYHQLGLPIFKTNRRVVSQTLLKSSYSAIDRETLALPSVSMRLSATDSISRHSIVLARELLGVPVQTDSQKLISTSKMAQSEIQASSRFLKYRLEFVLRLKDSSWKISRMSQISKGKV